jgi:hypothetical protein
MKHMKIFLLSIIGFYSHAQSDEKGLKFDVKLYLSGETGIGDNQLSKAHHIGKGIGYEMNFFSLKKVRAGFGYHFTTFNVRDQSLIGNYKRTNITDVYTNISYQIQEDKKIFFEPEIQLGMSYLRQKSLKNAHNTNFIRSKIMYAVGLAIHYRHKERTTIFLRTFYKGRIFDIESIPGYEGFFSNNHSLAITLGVNFFKF